MKKTSTGKRLPKKPKPILEWQTGEYHRRAQYKFILPYPFLLLCRLADVTPQGVLVDFMSNLSCGGLKREGREKVKENLINYFIGHGYGQHHYTETDIREMFREMDALGLLFPKDGYEKTLDLYVEWRKQHYLY